MPGRIVFGPVPSRRLGRSLGINNIPPKACSYGCVYCQVGPTGKRNTQRQAFYDPQEILQQVTSLLDALRQRGEPVDWLSFVPDGEPTLDIHLAETIDLLRPLGLPIAVISNASLVWMQEVRFALAKADWLSLKVDAVDPDVWRRVNGPAPRLHLPDILNGILAMAQEFRGTLTTETLLVSGVNDSAASVEAVADYLTGVHPSVAYLAAPTRPPADHRVRPPDELSLTRAYETMSARLPRVEYLINYEGNSFACTGEVEQDLLAIAAVHPVREDALRELLAKAGAGWDLVEGLISAGALRAVDHGGHRFYLRILRTD
jgi:wyosine [tRNA(Phe)-imidazoG37] synthetase (radical SAM superfamily)